MTGGAMAWWRTRGLSQSLPVSWLLLLNYFYSEPVCLFYDLMVSLQVGLMRLLGSKEIR